MSPLSRRAHVLGALAAMSLLASAAPAATAASAAPAATASAAPAAHPTVSRVSLSDRGGELELGSRFPDAPSISATGRYVAFFSLSSDVVPGDTNRRPDVFVRDRLAGTTVRASVRPDGSESPQGSAEATLSSDGRSVVFTTAAALVPLDRNGTVDVYERDLRRGTTVLVSARRDGRAGNGPSYFGYPSRDGRVVAFQTQASDLEASGDVNGKEDVYVRDLASSAGAVRISRLPDGLGFYARGTEPRVSSDGSRVLFSSLDRDDTTTLWVHDRTTGRTTAVPTGIARGFAVSSWVLSGNGRYVGFTTDDVLTAGDTNGTTDAFRLDLTTGRVVRVSESSTGRQGDRGSDVVRLSGDGSVAVFSSAATTLVPGDTNGVLDTFRRDLATGRTTRVSVASDGTQGDADSSFSIDLAVSLDGRHAAFTSFATTLVGNDTNGDPDVFAWDAPGEG